MQPIPTPALPLKGRKRSCRYAATDPRTGAAGSAFDTLVSDRHNHHVDVQGGLCADSSAELLRAFFRARR